MERLDIRYDLLARESEILHLHFWERAFELMKERGVIHFQPEGRITIAGSCRSNRTPAPTSMSLTRLSCVPTHRDLYRQDSPISFGSWDDWGWISNTNPFALIRTGTQPG